MNNLAKYMIKILKIKEIIYILSNMNFQKKKIKTGQVSTNLPKKKQINSITYLLNKKLKQKK